MTLEAAQTDPRRSLDQLVTEMDRPGFVSQHGREATHVARPGHVEPALLALAPPQSRYVRRWRRHARRCPECRQIFRSLGLSVR